VEEYLDRFITYLVIERNASPYTVRNYHQEVGEFLRFLKGEGVSSLQEVDRQHLFRYLLWLRAKGYAKASIRRRISELRSFFLAASRAEGSGDSGDALRHRHEDQRIGGPGYR